MKGINREILRLAGPSILANITVPFVGMVDIAVAGHLTGSLAGATLIGGISIGTMLFDLLYWNFGFLRVGTGGLTAQSYGRKDPAECARILFRGVSLAVFIALVILALQWPFVKLAFLIVDCSEEVRQLALKYFFIRIWAAPATLSLFSFKGWFIGMQDTMSSMAVDLTVNVVNILASIVFALGLPLLGFEGWGFPGIALGTVAAQYSGLLLAVGICALKYGKVFAGVTPRNALKGANCAEYMVISRDLFVRSVCLVVIYVGFTVISARFGDMLLATGAIMMKLLMLFSYFTDGFAYAGEALTGKYVGMRDREMTAMTVRRTFAWSMGLGMFFVLIYLAGGELIVRMMTSDSSVVASCRQFFVWLMPMPLVGCFAFTWDGIYVGATASKSLRNSTLAAVAAFFAVWFAAIALHGGVYDVTAMHLLMLAYFAHLLARAVWLQLHYRKAILTAPFRSDGKTA